MIDLSMRGPKFDAGVGKCPVTMRCGEHGEKRGVARMLVDMRSRDPMLDSEG